MALPKIKHSIYKHKLSGIDKTVSFRPYTNAEQKILLLAKEDADADQARILESIMQILKNCIVDGVDDVEDLPVFDVEDIFVRIRAKSVGEVITVRYKYDYVDEKGATKTDFVNVDINTDDIKVVGQVDKKDATIIVDKANNIGVKLRYPSLSDIKHLGSDVDDEELLIRCIEFIFDEDEVYNVKESTREELVEFIDSIESAPMLEIKKFFDSMPHLYYETEIKLKKLDKTETIKLKGLSDFFI